MKAIIFDFGNVVAFFDHRPAFKKLSPFTSMSVDAMFESVYTTPLEDRFERGLIDAAEFLEQAQAMWQLRCEAEFIERTLCDIFTANPEVCDLIPKLKGRYRIVLGSNTNAIHSRQFLAQFADVLSHFDHLVLSHAIKARKPEAAFYEHCRRMADAPRRRLRCAPRVSA